MVWPVYFAIHIEKFNMNIYQAINAAADQIEQNPKTFNFGIVLYPNDCSSPGCALGWIGYFCGFRGSINKDSYDRFGRYEWDVLRTGRLLGLDHQFHGTHPFYARMDKISDKRFKDSWRGSAIECARCLREYARLYHSDGIVTRTDFIPTIVRDIMRGATVIDVEMA